MSADHTFLLSGDLSICPQLRELRNSDGAAARLGPVNMKVLMLLIDRAGEIVTRDELFDDVWQNQVVSDDVLTRCISDIRATLRNLSTGQTFIETLPKRGYRWVPVVQRRPPGDNDLEAPIAAAAPISDTDVTRKQRHPSLTLIRGGLINLLALLIIATIGVWTIGQFARPGLPVIAVLPIRSGDALQEAAADIESQLNDHLMQLGTVSLLSQAAVDSRPGNPFPYFFYEFGARWIIESELRSAQPGIILTTRLVDARTGIVLHQASGTLERMVTAQSSFIEPALQPLTSFIEAQLEYDSR